MRPATFARDPRFSAISIEGSAGAGKSTVIPALKAELEEKGCICWTLPEPFGLAKSIGASPVPELWHDLIDFQYHLDVIAAGLEEHAYRMMKSLKTTKHLVLLVDSGRRRPMAYIGREGYLEMMARRGQNPEDVLRRYKAVIYLTTPAVDRPEHYTTDNNPDRRENAEEARLLDSPTFRAWNGHPHLIIVPSAETFEEKIQTAIRGLNRIVPMPTMHEVEDKFLLIGFRRSMLPPGTVTTRITQDYLLSADPAVERRVRAEEKDGKITYVETLKSKHAEGGRIEQEEELPHLADYEAALRLKDPECATINKWRHHFRHDNRPVTADEFIDVPGLWLAENEKAHIDVPKIVLPAMWGYVDVTDDKRFKNREIARAIKQERAHELLSIASFTPQA